MSEGSDLSLVLSAVGAAAGAMVVVRPEVIAGRMTDAELMWVSPGAHAQFGLVIGLRLSDVYGSDIAGLPLTVVAEAALRSPGLQVVAGPYEVSSPAGVSSMYELSAVADLEMVVVLFLDRTEQFLERLDVGRSQQLFRGLVDSLDSSEVVLRPQEVGGVVVDAVVEWANQATRNMSRDEQSLVPRDRVSERYLDVEEWLIDANEAWRGRPSSRILSRVAGHLGWRVCEQTINRVSDVLLQSTHNRSNDEDLLAKLSASEYRFASLIEDLPSTVFVGDFGSTEIDFISPNSITLLGRNPLQLHESSVLAALLHPDDRQRWGDVIEWATSDRLSYSADWRMRRDDGSDFTVSVSMVRRANVLAVEGYVALMLDVTDERARQRQLEESERLQSLSRAAGSIAHDFNNLLMVVAGNIDLARGLVPLAEMPLAEAKRATEKATALARTMLMFARAHPGHIGLVSVSSTLERLAEFASFEVPYGVYIVNSCATDLPPVLVDPEHLEHVVRALFSNAFDAVGRGGTVSVSASLVDAARCHMVDDLGPVARYVMVTVADDGPGIPSELMGAVWEPFFSTKLSASERGKGLGLSAAHGMVHQNGGHICIDSTEGSGTKVILYLPVAETIGG